MRRTPLVVLATAAVVALVAVVAARGDIFRNGPYFDGYVAPTHGGHTAYSDGCSTWWVGNKAYWPGSDPARITFIDVNGGWHYTKKSTINPVSQAITVEMSEALGRTKE